MSNNWQKANEEEAKRKLIEAAAGADGEKSEEYKTVEAEFIPAGTPPDREMTLKRTKRLVKTILDMSEEDALTLLREQVTTKLLLINDAVLKWLEVLEHEEDWKRRAEAAQYIQTLEACATQITTSKIQLDKALGAGLEAHRPQDARRLGEPECEVSAEEFLKVAQKAAHSVGQPPPPDKLGHA